MFTIRVYYITSNITNASGDVIGFNLANKPIDVNSIRNFDNFKRQIEDEIFSFRSDDLSFEILTDQESSNYFDPKEFITSGLNYRLDIVTDTGANYTLFTTGDYCHRRVDPPDDFVEVTAFELTSFAVQQGWYLGTKTRENPGDPVSYVFSTGNAALNVDDICDLIRDDMWAWIIKFEIPLPNFGTDITENTIGNQITGTFDEISTEAGDYYVLDYFIDDFNHRIFLILISNIWDGGRIYDWHHVQIAEIQNGTDLVFLDHIAGTIGSTQPGMIGFVHRWDTEYTNETVNGGNVVLYSIVRFNTGGQQLWTATFSEYKYDSDTGELKRHNQFDLPVESTLPPEWMFYYVNESGGIVSDSANRINNFSFINSYPISNSYGDWATALEQYTYTFSDFLNNDDCPFAFYYCSTCDFVTSQFPTLLRFTLKDVTIADIMKELCIAQDGIWYLDYSGDGVSILFRGRNYVGLVTDTAIPTEDILYLDHTRKYLVFSEIGSQIFGADVDRMQAYEDYYTNKYGNGKQYVTLKLYGLKDYSIGRMTTFSDTEYGISGYLMVNLTEWDEREEVTYVELMEIGAA